jgi:hypothetical protein
VIDHCGRQSTSYSTAGAPALSSRSGTSWTTEASWAGLCAGGLGLPLVSPLELKTCLLGSLVLVYRLPKQIQHLSLDTDLCLREKRVRASWGYVCG